MERLGGKVFYEIRSRHTMARACVAKAMSAEICVSDAGFSSVVARVLRETDVLLLRSKSC